VSIASRAQAIAADDADELRDFRTGFRLPKGTIYLDGNSLGPPSDAVERALSDLTEEWASLLVTGWDRWVGLPLSVGDDLGSVLLGAAAGQVVVTDSTTINLYKTAAAALALRPERSCTVLEDEGFPTDRYVITRLGTAVRRVPLPDIVSAIDDTVALVVVSAVDFRSAELADIEEITGAAHACGALVLWDLSHAVGALPLRLDEWDVDFAVGCTYKYVNAGPGAPAFVYVARRLHDGITQPIPGWFGHADQFAMETDYRPAGGVARFLTGTPNIAGTAAVGAGVSLLRAAGLERLRRKSIALTELAIERADVVGVQIAAPREAARRGSHVAVRHPRAADLCAALAERHRVITDHRPPDIVRLGFAPLYNRFVEVWDAFDAIEAITI